MKLTKPQEHQLVRDCAKGVKIDVLAQRFNISPRTVDRIISKHRAQGMAVVIKRGRPRKVVLSDRMRVERIEPDPSIVDETVKQLINTPFPYPAIASVERIQRDVKKLRTLHMSVDKANIIQPRDWTGVGICSGFFPNRFEATWKSSTSARSAWNDERMLRRAVRFQLRHGDPVKPHRVLRAITLHCRTPTIFRPSIARFIYERYCFPGGRVWDPCAGFGGRLLGAWVAGVHYIGTDVEPRTVDGNLALARMLNTGAEVYCARAEDFSPPEADLVFTSPPYFNRERYSNAENQSWKRHGESLEQWIENFITPVAKNAHGVLRKNGHLILNVADLREGERVLPIVSMVTNTLLHTGFAHVETLSMPLAAINRVSPTEPILVFKKPI